LSNTPSSASTTVTAPASTCPRLFKELCTIKCSPRLRPIIRRPSIILAFVTLVFAISTLQLSTVKRAQHLVKLTLSHLTRRERNTHRVPITPPPSLSMLKWQNDIIISVIKEMLGTLQILNSHFTRTNFIILPETFQSWT